MVVLQYYCPYMCTVCHASFYTLLICQIWGYYWGSPLLTGLSRHHRRQPVSSFLLLLAPGSGNTGIHELPLSPTSSPPSPPPVPINATLGFPPSLGSSSNVEASGFEALLSRDLGWLLRKLCAVGLRSPNTPELATGLGSSAWFESYMLLRSSSSSAAASSLSRERSHGITSGAGSADGWRMVRLSSSSCSSRSVWSRGWSVEAIEAIDGLSMPRASSSGGGVWLPGRRRPKFVGRQNSERRASGVGFVGGACCISRRRWPVAEAEAGWLTTTRTSSGGGPSPRASSRALCATLAGGLTPTPKISACSIVPRSAASDVLSELELLASVGCRCQPLDLRWRLLQQSKSSKSSTAPTTAPMATPAIPPVLREGESVDVVEGGLEGDVDGKADDVGVRVAGTPFEPMTMVLVTAIVVLLGGVIVIVENNRAVLVTTVVGATVSSVRDMIMITDVTVAKFSLFPGAKSPGVSAVKLSRAIPPVASTIDAPGRRRNGVVTGLLSCRILPFPTRGRVEVDTVNVSVVRPSAGSTNVNVSVTVTSTVDVVGGPLEVTIVLKTVEMENTVGSRGAACLLTCMRPLSSQAPGLSSVPSRATSLLPSLFLPLYIDSPAKTSRTEPADSLSRWIRARAFVA